MWIVYNLSILCSTDFILTYQTEVKEKKKRTADDKEKTQAKREKKRKVFLENLKKQGVEHEIQASEVSIQMICFFFEP